MTENKNQAEELLKQLNHDIRSPLSIIKNETELLSMKYGDGEVEAIKKAVLRIEEMLLIDKIKKIN